MITVFEKKCNEGDGASCLLAGWWFSDGKNVPIDDTKAIRFFEKGANLNDFESCCNLGNRYENGKGVEQNYDKAKLYYKKACNAGWKCGCESLERLLVTAPSFENNIFTQCNASIIEYTHLDTKIIFTDKIGSLKFNGLKEYDDPRLGISVSYKTIGIVSTIFIYNLGIENISDKPFSYDVVGQFYKGSQDIMRLHEDTNVLGIDIVSDDNKYILYEKVEFNENNIKKYSYLLVWGYHNNFIKIRFTCEADIEEKAFKEFERQLLYMGQYVEEGILNFDMGLESFQKGDQKLAYMIWNHLAGKNDIASMYGLAIIHISSENVEYALYWLNKSAEEGYAMAQYVLGKFYCEGEYVEKDMQQCARWIKKAKENGYEAEYDIWNDLSLEKYL